MVSDIKTRLKKLNVDADSELGQYLIKLDEAYSEVEDIKKQISKLEKDKEQKLDDIDMMENLIMYKFNKRDRKR